MNTTTGTETINVNVEEFFMNAKDYLSDGRNNLQEIHITHKTIEPFCWWNIPDIGRRCGYTLLGTVVFDR